MGKKKKLTRIARINAKRDLTAKNARAKRIEMGRGGTHPYRKSRINTKQREHLAGAGSVMLHPIIEKINHGWIRQGRGSQAAAMRQ
jgi:hypothetical protein